MAARRTSSTAEQIAELSARRERLREQMAMVQAAPRALAEASADVAKAVTELASRVEPQVAWLAQGPAGYADLAHALAAVTDHETRPVSPASFLAWAAPAVLAAAIERDLVAAYASLPAPMASAARQAELARIAKQLAGVESEVVATWWAAVDSGLQPPPPDISGAVLIGLDP
jgi:hypothetical protein